MFSISQRLAYVEGYHRAQAGRSHANGLWNRVLDTVQERESREQGFRAGLRDQAQEQFAPSASGVSGPPPR